MRYGHQPYSEVLKMPIYELALMRAHLQAILKAENKADKA